MKTKAFAITAIASRNVKRLENTRWQIREILVQEQDHQIDLATALGEDVPDVNAGPQRRSLRMR